MGPCGQLPALRSHVHGRDRPQTSRTWERSLTAKPAQTIGTSSGTRRRRGLPPEQSGAARRDGEEAFAPVAIRPMRRTRRGTWRTTSQPAEGRARVSTVLIPLATPALVQAARILPVSLADPFWQVPATVARLAETPGRRLHSRAPAYCAETPFRSARPRRVRYSGHSGRFWQVPGRDGSGGSDAAPLACPTSAIAGREGILANMATGALRPII